MSEAPTYYWHITVRQWDHYGDRVVTRTPAIVEASDKEELTERVRAMFNAKYDRLRKFWSHDWLVESVEVVRPASSRST